MKTTFTLTMLGIAVMLANSATGQVNMGDLRITEVMSSSGHPSGPANDDWWELVNIGSAPIDLDGYVWDDNDELIGGDYTVFPSVMINPGQSIILVREDDSEVPGGLREAWNIPQSTIILDELDMIGGPTGDTFSGLSSGGDMVNLYDPNFTPVAQRIFGIATSGFSFEWTTDNMDLGLSVDGENFAYTAFGNGAGGPGTDVGSPGLAVGLLAPVDGDFNDDGMYDCLDVDALVVEIVNGSNDPNFDLDNDGVVDNADLASWRSEAGESLFGPGKVVLEGDADLNGSVDGQDFIVWNDNKFTSVAAWCAGDFDASGAVDGADFIVWNDNKFTSVDAVAVPEPTFCLPALLALGWLFFGDNRR